MADQPEVPPFIRDLVAACEDMSDIELMIVLGPILTVLIKRIGPTKLRERIESGIQAAEAMLGNCRICPHRAHVGPCDALDVAFQPDNRCPCNAPR